MKTPVIILSLMVAAHIASASEKPNSAMEKDRAAILAMAGEYQVHFAFEETYPLSAGYILKEPYEEEALERVVVVEDKPEKVVLQHLLILGEGKRIQKHWTQIWTYQDNKITSYIGNDRWQRRDLPAEEVVGMWTQRVGQVDDSPRYEGIGKWRHENGISIWEAEAWRPLPRREHTTREDYDVLVSVNRHVITPEGWVHEQDNSKLVLRDGEEKRYLAREKGCNRYVKTKGEGFALADAWWQERGSKWNAVREAWEEYFEKAGVLSVRMGKRKDSLTDLTNTLVRTQEEPAKIKTEMLALLAQRTTSLEAKESPLAGVAPNN